MLWQNYKLFLNKRDIMLGKTQFDIPAKAYQKVSYYFNVILRKSQKGV